MQASLKCEQDGFLALRRELVQHAGAARPAIRKAVEISRCIDRQRAFGKVSHASTIEIEDGGFFSGAVDLEYGSRQRRRSKQIATAVENDGSLGKRGIALNIELMKCPKS